MKIYLARNNIQAGPYTLDELNTMLASGEVVLDDLAWHSGMSHWQRLGDLTQNQLVYHPQLQTTSSSNHAVDRLYGRTTTHSNSQTAINPDTLTKPSNPTQVEYATISSRLLATLINLGALFLTLLPLILAFSAVFDVNEFTKLGHDYASIQAYSQRLANKIPSTTTAISNILLIALLSLQLLLISRRGQSLGKLIMGIRVIDKTHHTLPSFGTLVVMRTVCLVILYLLATMTFSSLPAVVMLIANYLIANTDTDKQGWHDKLTKTLVVKAHPSQLQKRS